MKLTIFLLVVLVALSEARSLNKLRVKRVLSKHRGGPEGGATDGGGDASKKDENPPPSSSSPGPAADPCTDLPTAKDQSTKATAAAKCDFFDKCLKDDAAKKEASETCKRLAGILTTDIGAEAIKVRDLYIVSSIEKIFTHLTDNVDAIKGYLKDVLKANFGTSANNGATTSSAPPPTGGGDVASLPVVTANSQPPTPNAPEVGGAPTYCALPVVERIRLALAWLGGEVKWDEVRPKLFEDNFSCPSDNWWDKFKGELTKWKTGETDALKKQFTDWVAWAKTALKEVPDDPISQPPSGADPAVPPPSGGTPPVVSPVVPPATPSLTIPPAPPLTL